ncbi:MAG: hypothetical protein WAQ24_01655 [Candidatus Saccharimonadales bacterium]
MIKEYGVTNGYFDCSTLPNADLERLQQFYTRPWAEMGELLVNGEDGLREYPHIFDEYRGHLRSSERQSGRHPMDRVEAALQGELHNISSTLRLLSFQVGQIAKGEAPPAGWERIRIGKIERTIEEWLPKGVLRIPEKRWSPEAITEYYARIRAVESDELVRDVAELAVAVVAQNKIEPLYVASESGLKRGTGWLARLIGLTVDTGHTNDYRHQVHDVIAAVEEGDGTAALLRGANGLYSLWPPFRQ